MERFDLELEGMKAEPDNKLAPACPVRENPSLLDRPEY
jgi:hypothetical protein